MYVQNGSASVELNVKDQTEVVSEKLIIALTAHASSQKKKLAAADLLVRVSDFAEPERSRWDYSSCAEVGSVDFFEAGQRDHERWQVIDR